MSQCLFSNFIEFFSIVLLANFELEGTAFYTSLESSIFSLSIDVMFGKGYYRK